MIWKSWGPVNVNLKRGDELGVERAGVDREEEVDDAGELLGEAWKDWPNDPEVRILQKLCFCFCYDLL